MPIASPYSPNVPPRTQQRLVAWRAVLIGVEAGGLLGLAWGLHARLPVAPMLGVLGLHGLLLAWAWWRLRGGAGARGDEVFAQLLVDAAALAALVYFSGGYANPFISLLLLPLILCAVVCRPLQVWGMTAWVGLLYSLLAVYYRPLRLEMSGEAAVNLHLAGMWLNFLLTAVLVALFVARLATALRDRERALAEAREKALRDEQLFALGMQAAAAAHDLATPLAGLAVSLGELRREYVGDDELGPELERMGRQAERMKAVLGRLAVAAGAAPAAPANARPLDAWLAEVFEHWRLMRPQAPARLVLKANHPAPPIRPEPSLVSVLATLLNNAADASPEEVLLEADWDAAQLRLRVLDRGPGLGQKQDKQEGWGVGLQLARAALERLGGGLEMAAREGGGLAVEARLPLEGLRP